MSRHRTITLPNGVIKEMVPTTEWHCGFSLRNWRIGACFQSAMWEFDFLWFYVWCDRYNKYGRTLYDPHAF